jgi:hypothetical protein
MFRLTGIVDVLPLESALIVRDDDWPDDYRV